MCLSESESEKLLKFLEYVYMLKEIRRRGWMKKGVSRIESVADHSFSLALMSMVMADMRGLNVERSVGMALLHDLCESIVGDLTPKDRTKIGVEKSLEEEHRATKYVLSFLPPSLAKKYLDLWEEYKTESTAEAKLVKELDRLERALQAVKYTKNKALRKVLKRFWEEFLKTSQDNFLRDVLQHAIKTQE
ncbi:MAG: HD domain-containing protein [Nitrososphaerota archaeon]|nr:HD domain-containing protein [Aigarchaeota archaeon]MDW8076279.1 HD domain-containing protein [Nitrososphaerota archaeon]